MNPQLVSERTHAALAKADVPFREVQHEDVLDYETAAKVRDEFDLVGTESKSLFLRRKDKQYFMFVSTEGTRVDTKAIKEIVGGRVSIASDEELESVTGCRPGCAVPFGLPETVGVIVDEGIFDTSTFLFSPGEPSKTISLETHHLRRLIEALPNDVSYYSTGK